jgi:hypothetical protein
MTKCEIIMNENNQQLLWDPIFGYYNEGRNQPVLWDPYGVLQWMKKTNDYYGTLYAGIAMNVKVSEHYGTHMGCCNEWKKLVTIMGPYMRVL